MDQVRLGKSGLSCSVLGLGGGSSGQFGLTKGGSRKDAIYLIRSALDAEITLFDGAGLCGVVDPILRDGLGADRQRIVLSSKVHLGPVPTPFSTSRFANRISADASRNLGILGGPADLRARLEQTLHQLGTDWLDILFLHAVTARQYRALNEPWWRMFEELISEGKIRAIGISEAFLVDPQHEMLARAVEETRLDIVMCGHSLTNRSAEFSLVPKARTNGLGTVGMYVIRGLSSEWNTGQTVSSSFSKAPLAKLQEIAGVKDLAELAYRFCVHHSGLDLVMTGTGDSVHLSENVAAIRRGPLPEEALTVIDRLSQI